MFSKRLCHCGSEVAASNLCNARKVKTITFLHRNVIFFHISCGAILSLSVHLSVQTKCYILSLHSELALLASLVTSVRDFPDGKFCHSRLLNAFQSPRHWLRFRTCLTARIPILQSSLYFNDSFLKKRD